MKRNSFPLYSFKLYTFLSSMGYWSVQIRNKFIKPPFFKYQNEAKYCFEIDYLNTVNDCCDFLGISLNNFSSLFSEHNKWTSALWEKVNHNHDEYNKRIQDYGPQHIVANCVCSFSLRYTYETLFMFLKEQRESGKQTVICDFGCCNANLSFALLQHGIIDHLIMTDLRSKASEFIKYRIDKYGLSDKAEWHDATTFNLPLEAFNGIICFDVLEHLPEPSKILREKLTPALKRNGMLFLQAPWGGGVPSHLDKAIIDFYTNGGRKLLHSSYNKIYSMTGLDISGVWVKK